MGRIKLAIPANVIGHADVAVRITDINYGHHLGNDSLISILHEARVIWLRKNNCTELDAAGTSLIMGDLVVEYINESFYGDVLSISIAAGEVTRVSFELFYEVHTTREGKVIPIARAKTGMICYDYSVKKVMSIPQGLKDILRAT